MKWLLDPRARESQAHQQMLCFSLSRTLRFGEWPVTVILGYTAGHGEVLLPTKPQRCHRRAFPGFQPRDISRCQPSRHLGAACHTRTSLFDSWYQGCSPYVKISQKTTTGSRRQFLWWTSYTWCSPGASSGWAALCGRRPGRKRVSRMASVTWRLSSHHQGEKCGREMGCIFPLSFICIY